MDQVAIHSDTKKDAAKPTAKDAEYDKRLKQLKEKYGEE